MNEYIDIEDIEDTV